MPLTDATLNAQGDNLASLITHFSVHTADPGTTGINESAAPRVAATWGAAGTGAGGAADPGAIRDTDVLFTGGTPDGPVHSIGYWSASSGGTFRGSRTVSGGTTFDATGEYLFTEVVEDHNDA